MIEAADESQDQSKDSTNGDRLAGVSAVQFEPAKSPASVADSATTAVAALRSVGEVREFFSKLQVRRAPSGNVVIEAPAEAASTLGALFEGMAALLQTVAAGR
jgi:hypothetical protein